MIKTQVQIPDELYHKAKAVAKAREWSLAEVFRRGLEYMTRVHEPASGLEGRDRCALPVLPAGHFQEGFDELDLKRLAMEDEARVHV